MNKPKIFLSYAREDRSAARKLKDSLATSGLEVWFDEDSMVGGQNWKLEITKAINECDFFLPVLSTISVNKRGIIQKELREALEVFENFPEGKIYIVPVRLEECIPSFKILNDIHWIDLFRDWDRGVKDILRSIALDKGDFDPDGTSSSDNGSNNKKSIDKIYITSQRISEIVYNAVSSLSEYANERDIQFNIVDKSEGAFIETDEKSLARALKNILHNAVKYSYRLQENDSWVRVKTISAPEYFEISVENWGLPILPETIEKGLIYKYFYTTDNDREMGFGLAVVKRIMESINGDISVSSLPARGNTSQLNSKTPYVTIFTIKLPKSLLL